MPAMPGMNMQGEAAQQGQGHMAMNGALGPYAMARDGSGTSWQPDAVANMTMTERSGWMTMAHALLNGSMIGKEAPGAATRRSFQA
jgi:hypothetical protein